jgi:hypothetical protein
MRSKAASTAHTPRPLEPSRTERRCHLFDHPALALVLVLVLSACGGKLPRAQLIAGGTLFLLGTAAVTTGAAVASGSCEPAAPACATTTKDVPGGIGLLGAGVALGAIGAILVLRALR